MTVERANKIYDVLTTYGGATDYMRDSFVYHFTNNIHDEQNTCCEEWRFCGKLGYGGKYLLETNTVTCYQEDETKQTLKIIDEINNRLKKI